MSDHDQPEPEFSFTVDPAEIGEKEAVYRLEPNAAERAALAARFGLVSLGGFRAEVALRWLRRGELLRLKGRIEADLEQECVVTLEPFPVHVDEPVEILYSRATDGEGSREVDIADIADAEPLPEGDLDIGEVISEELALALDPFPRRPGAELSESDSDSPFDSSQDAENKGEKSPFEVLATLRRKD